MRLISLRYCFLVPLSVRQSISSFCFKHGRVCLQVFLHVIGALSRHVSQPLLVVTPETINVDQIVVSGFVLGIERSERMKKEGNI